MIIFAKTRMTLKILERLGPAVEPPPGNGWWADQRKKEKKTVIS